MQIPAFLLRKLYIKGSLENVEGGFSLKLKNSLSPGTTTAVAPIKVDGNEYPLDTLTIRSVDGEVLGSEISEENTFPIKVGVEIELFVKGEALSEGEHKIDLSLKTKEAGTLAFDVTDSI
ncbi:MAG: hydroxymethylglutaryl-CoA reductase [Promethearchaeota archaeon]